MTVTSLIKNRKLMMRESETIIWLMVFEDLAMIIVLALLSAGDQNLIFFAAKIIFVLAILYIIAGPARNSWSRSSTAKTSCLSCLRLSP